MLKTQSSAILVGFFFFAVIYTRTRDAAPVE
jgi:hypothetical protein